MAHYWKELWDHLSTLQFSCQWINAFYRNWLRCRPTSRNCPTKMQNCNKKEWQRIGHCFAWLYPDWPHGAVRVPMGAEEDNLGKKQSRYRTLARCSTWWGRGWNISQSMTQTSGPSHFPSLLAHHPPSTGPWHPNIIEHFSRSLQELRVFTRPPLLPH